jgi:hypothetical protein
MDPELLKLLDDAGITGDDRTKALEAFSSESLQKAIKNGVMRQSDYSRNMDALKTQRTALEESWTKANAEYVKMQTDFTSTQAERDAAQAKLKEAEDKLAAAAAIDLTKYVPREELGNEFAKYAAGQTAFFGDVLEIADEHRELFGSKISANQLMKDAMAAKKTPKEFWEEKYQVETKRQEVAKKADDDRIAQIKADARKEAMAELSDPNRRPLAPSDRPFYESTSSDGNAKNPWDDLEPTVEERNLVSALQEAGR